MAKTLHCIKGPGGSATITFTLVAGGNEVKRCEAGTYMLDQGAQDFVLHACLDSYKGDPRAHMQITNVVYVSENGTRCTLEPTADNGEFVHGVGVQFPVRNWETLMFSDALVNLALKRKQLAGVVNGLGFIEVSASIFLEEPPPTIWRGGASSGKQVLINKPVKKMTGNPIDVTFQTKGKVRLLIGRPRDTKRRRTEKSTREGLQGFIAAEAIDWYHKAAEQGDASAQYTLGSLYASGNGVAADMRRAVTLMRMAAAQGHAKAMVTLPKLVECPLSPPGTPVVVFGLITSYTYNRRTGIVQGPAPHGRLVVMLDGDTKPISIRETNLRSRHALLPGDSPFLPKK